MIWIDIVTAVALFQYLVFGTLVAQARGKYGVNAPATTGHEMFERAYRIQMNTLELLVVFVPALWMAGRYWSPAWVAAAGAVFIVGRLVYFRAYTADPATRTLGFSLSIAPIVGLIAATGIGALLAALKSTP